MYLKAPDMQEAVIQEVIFGAWLLKIYLANGTKFN